MKAILVSKENNTVKFTMEFSAEEFESATVAAYKKNKNQFPVDGFRKGKAPRSIIEKMYGEGVFWDEAIDALLNEHYVEALDELKLEVIDRPQMEGISDLKKGEGFTVNFSVDVYPEIEVKDYKGVEVEQVIAAVEDKEIDAQIEAIRKRNARMTVVEGAAEDGDTVILDYAGFVGEEQFEGGTAEQQELKLGSGQFIPGFEEQLVGVKPEESKDVVVTFPEEYQAPELAGKEAVFKCTVHEIKREELPALDDEFVQEVSEFDTLDEYKADLKEKALKDREAMNQSAAKNEIVKKITDANEFDVPAAMVEDEIERNIQQMNANLMQQGLSLDMYMQYTGQDMDGLKNEIREDCKGRVASQVVLRAIVEAEGIEVTDEDIEQEFKDMANLYNMDLDKVKEILADSVEMMKSDIKVRKAIDMLYAEAKVNMVEAPAAPAETEKTEE